jgi:hypothetical protein
MKDLAYKLEICSSTPGPVITEPEGPAFLEFYFWLVRTDRQLIAHKAFTRPKLYTTFPFVLDHSDYNADIRWPHQQPKPHDAQSLQAFFPRSEMS